MPLPLPLLDTFRRTHEHDDIQGQIVADPEETADLHDDDHSDHDPDLGKPGDHESNSGHGHIADGVEDAVADIAEGDGGFAVAVDDEGRILEEFPARFDEESDEEAVLHGQAAGDEPEEAVENHAVDDVGERIGVGYPLGILTGPDIAIPPAERAVGTEG